MSTNPTDPSSALALDVNREVPEADAYLRRLTPWPDVDAMVEAVTRTAVVGGRNTYRPTCRIDLDPGWERVADAFDLAMEMIGDTRRAWRVGAAG